MTTHQDKDKHINFECDGCDEIYESGMPFAYAWAEAKKNGWKAEKVDEQWLHLCPRCK